MRPHAAYDRCLDGKHILVVEDAEENRVILQVLLEHEGAIVATAEDGFAALARVREQKIDMVLMDIQMPGLDGFETLELIRQRGYEGPVLAVTASDGNEDKQRCAAAGFAAHLPKSMSREQLRQEVRKHMSLVEKGVSPMSSQSKENPPYADPELRPIIDGIMRRLPERLLEARRGIEGKDWETVSMVAHRLKGTLGGCGFRGLSDIAAELENEAKDRGSFQKAEELVNSLENAAAQVRY